MMGGLVRPSLLGGADEDPMARAERLLAEAKQMADMLSSAKGFSADAGGTSAPSDSGKVHGSGSGG